MKKPFSALFELERYAVGIVDAAASAVKAVWQIVDALDRVDSAEGPPSINYVVAP